MMITIRYDAEIPFIPLVPLATAEDPALIAKREQAMRSLQGQVKQSSRHPLCSLFYVEHDQ